jgi:hypothetical protein
MIALDARARLEIVCGTPDRNGRYRVTALWDGCTLHCDEFPPFESYRRAYFAEAVCSKLKDHLCGGSRIAGPEYLAVFGYDPNGNDDADADLKWIGAKVVEAAESAESGDELPRPVQIARLVVDHPSLAEPIVEGLLRRGETMNIIADPKRGKSWLAYGLALSVCTGDRWLGTFDCLACKVLLIDNELHPATLAHRIPIVADGLGIRHSDYEGQLDVLTLRGRLVDLHGIAKILESVSPGAYGLILLDAQYRSLPAGTSENDNPDMAALYNEIDRVAARLGCAWVNIHHASKGSQANKSITDVGAGAGAQSRAADTHLILREHEEPGCVVLESALRSFKPVEPMTLKWTFPIWQRADGIDPVAIKGRRTKAEEKKSQADREDCYKLIKALRPAPATIRVLRGKIGQSADRIERLLDILESKGIVAWTEVKKRGNPCREYRLLKDTQDVDG